MQKSLLNCNLEQEKLFLPDRMRRDELAAISGPNEFAEFYNRLKQIKEFHRKHPNEVGKLLLVKGHCKGFQME